MKDILIIGAGNGGCALAADLTARNFSVRLCSIYTLNRIKKIKEHGGIELKGVLGKGRYTPKIMTSNIEEALKNVNIIFCTVPANGIEFTIYKMIPYLESGQIIILVPGAVGGALFIRNLLKQERIRNINIGETCTLPYGCRLVTPYLVEIYDVAKNVLFAMLPDSETNDILDTIKILLPNFIKAETILETSMNYMNYLFHTPGMILNTGWIEHSEESFAFYYDGISPSVAKIIEAMDNERLNILRQFSLKTVKFEEWLFRRGKTNAKDSVYNAVHGSVPNKNYLSPDSLNHRFILEDVPYGLVPISFFGKLVNIDTPVTDALITISSHMCGINFMKEGRNLLKMGINNLSINEIKKSVL